ncbi:Uncharacterised protein [Mycobacterium tuberculosis]|nr:Uncharacterised protein [Mycobacterium tuberculosis]
MRLERLVGRLNRHYLWFLAECVIDERAIGVTHPLPIAGAVADGSRGAVRAGSDVNPHRIGAVAINCRLRCRCRLRIGAGEAHGSGPACEDQAGDGKGCSRRWGWLQAHHTIAYWGLPVSGTHSAWKQSLVLPPPMGLFDPHMRLRAHGRRATDAVSGNDAVNRGRRQRFHRVTALSASTPPRPHVSEDVRKPLATSVSSNHRCHGIAVTKSLSGNTFRALASG